MLGTPKIWEIPEHLVYDPTIPTNLRPILIRLADLNKKGLFSKAVEQLDDLKKKLSASGLPQEDLERAINTVEGIRTYPCGNDAYHYLHLAEFYAPFSANPRLREDAIGAAYSCLDDARFFAAGGGFNFGNLIEQTERAIAAIEARYTTQ